VVSSPFSQPPEESDALKEVDEILELRPISESSLAAPLSFSPQEGGELSLYIGGRIPLGF